MFKLDEFFPVESIGPFIGGALIWFAANYLFIGPDIIGPRLAAKYYMPACTAAVTDGRRVRAEQVATARRESEAQLQIMMQDLARQAGSQAQAQLGGILGTILDGYGREGAAFRNRYGGQMDGWLGGLMAPALRAQLQQRYQQERSALAALFDREEREARRGIVHATPAQFCGCVVSEGLKDRIELATFTATLRLYTPQTIRRLEEGTMVQSTTPACGSAPIV
ncbi:hypothetical protein HB662_28680 [Roseomonas frigidaquae]|uniref:Uncharacterized protein n=1 Tax=Falsiroseomonas frigidaquae TaxID=487318 RepID=A0ABX1F964_9PROT|nr:hypothetical protein [Falsiroseomonas frigidaquae]NKE48775.1 hypothetical protein [Falsiroseomonas frigidaquae]